MFQRVHGDAAVRERATGSQRHGDKDTLSHFFICRAGRFGALDVGIDAIWTLPPCSPARVGGSQVELMWMVRRRD